MRRAALLLVLLAAAGCGPVSSAEQASNEAMFACAAKFDTEFPGVAPETEDGRDPGPEFDDNFRIASTGQFVFEAKEKGAQSGGQPALSCTGDINKRLISSVQYRGTIKRPPQGQVWSF